MEQCLAGFHESSMVAVRIELARYGCVVLGYELLQKVVEA